MSADVRWEEAEGVGTNFAPTFAQEDEVLKELLLLLRFGQR